MDTGYGNNWIQGYIIVDTRLRGYGDRWVCECGNIYGYRDWWIRGYRIRLRICGCRNIIWVGGYVDTRRAYERYEKTYNWGYTYMYINTGIGGYADTGYHRGYGVAGILYGYADTWIRGKLMRCMRRHTYGGIYEYRYWWIRGYAIL